MKVSVLQENLAASLAAVVRAVENKPYLPVLANVKLETLGNRGLQLTGTNLELTIIDTIPAMVDEDGAITLPARTFSELVNNLSPERVELTLDEKTQTVTVKCGTTNSKIKGISATEYPQVNAIGGQVIELGGHTLRQALKEVLFAAAKEDTRPILTGICFRIGDDEVTLAAADGYRLSVRRITGTGTTKQPELVIPARSLAEVMKNTTDEDVVYMELPSDKVDRVGFTILATNIQTQLLEGRFPDFEAIIPKTHNTEIAMYADDLRRACKRAEVFSRDSANSTRIIAEPTGVGQSPDSLMVKGISSERGDLEGVLDVRVDGEPLEAAYNVKYLLDPLAVMAEERVLLRTNGAAHPAVLIPEGREDWITVVMPMSVNR